MDPQEREVIDGIFQRLRQAEGNPRDPEAERYIADLVARQPYAPYALAQAVYVQELAVQQLTARNQEFEQRVRQLEDQARYQAASQQSQPSQQPAGGFLSGLFGGGQRTSVPPTGPARQAVPGEFGQSGPNAPGGNAFGAGPASNGPGQAGPWSRGAPQPGQAAGPWGGQPQQAPAGGGFLRGALTTAAGVAGGALLFDAVKGMMGGSSAANATPADKSAGAGKDDTAQQDAASKDTAKDDTASNDANSQNASDNGATQNDASYQDANYDAAQWDDDGGWDDGGDDDWT